MRRPVGGSGVAGSRARLFLVAALVHGWPALCGAAGEPASDAPHPRAGVPLIRQLAQGLPVIPARPSPLWVPLPAAPSVAPAAAPPAGSAGPQPSKPAAMPSPPPAAGPSPAVALILPLASADFALAAEAVHAGCRAAFAVAGDSGALQVWRTDASADQTLAAYTDASARGLQVIVGPLTRTGVTAVAGSGRVRTTTIALNTPEPGTPLPAGFYTFGMSVETEARLAARAAIQDGHRKAMVVQTPGALSRRVSQAFAAEWLALGGAIADVQDAATGTDLAPLRERIAKVSPDAVFLSADAGSARRIRPYLLAHLPVYSVSLVNDGRNRDPGNVDLNGVRFFDMPWLLQADHPAVMVYPRPAAEGADAQRFYALGIDACRIAGALLPARRPLTLDGVTGRITLRRDGGTVDREPVAAVFRDGAAAALDPSP